MKTTTKTKGTQSVKMRYITLTGLMAAMIALMTAYICHIPVGVNGGYIHFGDSLIYIAATLLPTPYALAAAAIGGGLADLMTSPMWAPFWHTQQRIYRIYVRQPDSVRRKRGLLPYIWHGA